MSRTVNQGKLQKVIGVQQGAVLVSEPLWYLDDKGAEAKVEGDAALLRLRVLVETSSAGNGAKSLAETRLARVYMAEHSNIDIEYLV